MGSMSFVFLTVRTQKATGCHAPRVQFPRSDVVHHWGHWLMLLAAHARFGTVACAVTGLEPALALARGFGLGLRTAATKLEATTVWRYCRGLYNCQCYSPIFLISL